MRPDLAQDAVNCPARAIMVSSQVKSSQVFLHPLQAWGSTVYGTCHLLLLVPEDGSVAFEEASAVAAAALQVRAHDLRAVSTSWNLLSLVRLSDLRAA